MRRLWYARLLAILTAGGLVAFSAPAWADSNINILPGNVPTTAEAHKTHLCEANQGGGPYVGLDVWVFNLPGNHNTTGDFLSVTATFSTPDGPQTKKIPDDGGAIVLIGTSKAYIALPAGWTLTGASAVISGTAEFFVLTHTCPASADGSPSPSPDPSQDPSPDPSGSTPGESPSDTPPGTEPPLPKTGAAVTGMLVAGAATIAGGAGLLWFLHRRRMALDRLDG